MRLAIRWKLMLGIGVPLLALLGLLLFLDYARLRESAYAETERREAEVAERYAASLDGTLRSLAQGAKTLASVFESNASFSEAEVYDFLARNVQSDGLIFGSALALEPGGWPFRMNEMGPPAPSSIPVAARPARAGFEPRGDLHAPYVFRGARTAGVDGAGAEAWAGLLRLDVAESYDYTDGQWAWYDGPSRSGLARWTEPYFDENAGNAAMVTFSQPFFRDGAFRGVVTVDVDLEGLSRRLRGAAGAEIILLSRRGAVVAGPAMFKPMEENIFEIAKRVGRPELERLGSEMVGGGRGTVPIVEPGTTRRMLAFFAPVSSTGWSVAGLVAERDVMAPVMAVLQQRLAGGLMFIAIILAVVLGMGVWIVRPIRRLAKSVRGMSLTDVESGGSGSGGGAGAVGSAAGAEAAPAAVSGDEVGELSAAIASMRGQIRAQVEALTRETAARQAVEAELRVARAIQTSLLPTVFPSGPGMATYGVSSPARFVGGDFFDVFPCGEGRFALVIADVSGKGVPAAMFMAVTRTLIRDVGAGELGPGACLDRANRMLLEANPECMFVSMFMARFDARTGVLRYANGGHPVPLVVNAAGEVRTMGETTGTVLGAMEIPMVAEREVTLEAGDRLVLYTDGVSEARAPSGEFYGVARLEALLKATRGMAAKEMCERALTALAEFQPQGQHDDITLLVLDRVGGEWSKLPKG